jgi:hypothetical protein
MAERGFVRPLVFVICLAVTAAGLVNVYGDNSEVQSSAEREACGGQNCTPRLLRMERSPFRQAFSFQTDRDSTVDVSCKREYVLLGEYGCVRR